MIKFNINKINKMDFLNKKKIFFKINKYLEKKNIKKRIIWCFKYLPKNIILTSSFGIQSIVSIHLINSYKPNIPIILIDTGYLFPETYNFIDKLTKKFKLNLKIFSSKISPAWQEARYGKLWEKGIKGIEFYNKINKIDPINHAFKKLKVKTWISGIRRVQSDTRHNLSILSIQNNVFKFLPIIDWNDKKINKYLIKNNLPNHPLFKKKYISVGDTHTTKKFKKGMKKSDTRFFGLKRECGIHEI